MKIISKIISLFMRLMKIITKTLKIVAKPLKIVAKPLKIVAKPLKSIAKSLLKRPIVFGCLFVVVAFLFVFFYRRNIEQFTTLSQAAPLNPINDKTAKF